LAQGRSDRTSKKKIGLAALAIAALLFLARETKVFAQSKSPIANDARAAQVYAIPGTADDVAAIADAADPALAVASNLAVRTIAVSSPLSAPSITGAKFAAPPFYLTTADRPNRVMSLSSGTLRALAGNGQAGSLGDGGAASAAQFALKSDSLTERSGIVSAADGTIFIADSLNGTIRRIAGSRSTEPEILRSIAGRWAPPENVTLEEPLGLALDRGGNLFIADRAAGAVLELPAATSPSPAALKILAHIAGASSIAATQDGANVFVASTTSGAVFEIDVATRGIRTILQFAAEENPCERAKNSASAALCPAGLAVDAKGQLFVSDANSSQVFRVAAKSEAITVVAKNFSAPGDMTIDAEGNLYVADQGRSRVVMFRHAAAAAAQCDTSTSGNLTLCPNDFNFTQPDATPPLPPEPVGGTTPTQPFTLTNNSASAITNFQAALVGSNSGDFQIASTSCVATLAASGSCTYNVLFSPSQTGARSGSLAITDSAAGDSVSATLEGTGNTYSIALAPPPQAQSVTVIAGNPATFNMMVVPDNSFSGNVTIVCPPNLPALSFCTVTSPTLVMGTNNVVNVPTPGTAAPFTVVIRTTSTTGVNNPPKSMSGGFLPRNFPGGGSSHPAIGTRTRIPFFSGLAFLLAGTFFTIFFVIVRSPRANGAAVRRSMAVRVGGLAATVLALAGILAGCHHTIATSTGTPAGTYNFLIQGTAQGAANGFVVQMVVTLK
jgi:sugar lactone lactonase YvrE